jgi:hypothetical protein
VPWIAAGDGLEGSEGGEDDGVGKRRTGAEDADEGD